jgi:hypothetical protein
MAKQKQTVEEMKKIIFDELHIRGMKKLLSRRKDKSGKPAYEDVLKKLEAAEKRLRGKSRK